YSSVLALLSLFTKRRWSTILIRHVNTVHLVAFVVYAYRDLYPLTIFDQTPQDASEGSVLWARIGLLTLATIVIPLVIPRQYVPYNPEKPEEPNPEQTASLLSLTLYTFMDPIVFKAWKASKVQLEREDLPHLPDYDHSYNLRARMFGHLDPMKVKRRNLFFSLMRAFRTDYMVLFTMLFVRALSGFTTPVAVKGLLNYIEQKGIGVPTKPWVWILVLLLGPTIESLSFEWYIFIATRALVRTEAILTQLVFEHALRIRMKSETNDTSKEKQQQISSPEDTSKPATPTPPESASQTDSDSDSRPPPPPATPVPTTPSPSPSGGAAPGEDDKKKSSAANLVGRMNNLVTSDLQSIVDARDFGMLVVYTPIQIVLCIIFLYQVLGWSSFLGLATIIILFPLPGYLAKLVQRAQKAKMKKTDARIETVTETMNVLRMVKMFGWERLMNERIAAKREEELTYIKRMRLLDLATMLTNHIIPIITMLVTYATYTLVMKEPLTASKVFSSMVVFEKFQFQLRILLFVMNQSIAAKVSLDRITDFLYNTELLDTYKQKDNGAIEEVSTSIISSESSQDIGFRNATFTWSNDSDDGTLTPSRRRFQLRIEEELLFKRGCINLIVGPTGCGKTSMLMALLSEMHFVQTNPDSWFNLPRDKGVAYAAQESWVQNATIKDNIVFRSEFNEARYKKVLHQCALERDLTLFEAGDATEVGEKGLTLSGGQKARITLARAVYSDAEIILLDDVLAALDVHTSKWIVERCFKGDLIKGRTVLLVTHNLVLTQPIAGFVVSMKDGKIASQGTVSDALDHNRSLVAEARQEEQELQIAEETIDVTAPVADGSKSDGKLIIAEEVEIGHVGWPAMRLFIKALGGNHVFLFFLTYMGMIGLSEFAEIGQTWFLGYWAEQYEKMNPEDVNVVFYLSSYVLILAFVIGTFAIAFIVNMFGAIRSSRSIHKQLMTSILGTGHLVFKMQWLDTTPTSRVITRCTKDMNDVDRPIPQLFGSLLQYTLSLIAKFAAVIIYTPVFLAPGILIAIMGGLLGQIYIHAQLPIKRLQSNAKAPVLGHFGAAIAGITSIRAYGVQESFKSDSLKHIDFYSRPSRTFYNLNRWIDIRVDALANLFAASLAAYLVYYAHQSSSNVGFSLNMAVGFSSGILWWIRMANMFETQANSLERINRYIDIEKEPTPSDDRVPPAYWPSSGDLRVEKLSARYSPDGPKVLRDISFNAASGERIGVVGRTGSGKSSLMLSLLRCIYTDGEVYYDGIPTASLNLENLRTNITIIPQVPELLSGSVRKNLDPFEQHDDAILNDALRSAGLYSVQSEEESDRITLDTAISSGGSNLSVGQRQILALARAMVRGSKLLILDEGMYNLYYKTDTIIQSSLRRELKGDVTLITVAHRLQTIMDADKIMVLDAGNIVEFDKPSVLLQDPNGKLRALVDESADKDHLYEMAGL
ncbi:P-loop containing nucleoside triphosphate hydrolase protein, partial [Dendrothele bispora CBS 962.96]